jgi:hypothetical protein
VQPSGHRLSVVSPRRHVGFFRRVFRGHVWFQAVAASPLRVSDEGVVVEDAAQSSKRSSATGWITSSPERPPGRMARSVAGSPRRSCGSPDRGCGHSWLLRACARNRSPRSVRSSASTVAPHSKQSRCMSLAPVQADPRPFVEANRRVVTPACSERARLDHRVRPRALTMTCPGEVAASDSARRAQRGTASAVGAPRARDRALDRGSRGRASSRRAELANLTVGPLDRGADREVALGGLRCAIQPSRRSLHVNWPVSRVAISSSSREGGAG